MDFKIAMKSNPPVLTRIISWEDWEKGRAYRRAIAFQATGKTVLRRTTGDPRKDVILRRLNKGERGMPFEELAP